MCWLVETRFSMGIWLHNPANDHRNYIRNALYFEVDDYETALKLIKNEGMNMDEFRPNRLYKVKEDKIFVVFYNKKYVGFSEMQNSFKFMQKNKIAWKFYRKRWRLTYQQAIGMVTSLGAMTGEDKIFRRRTPICGKMYRRY